MEENSKENEKGSLKSSKRIWLGWNWRSYQT